MRFRNKTSGINTEIDNQINELLDEIAGTDDTVESFVSKKTQR